MEAMMKDAIEVEVNLIFTGKKKKDEGEGRREEGERRNDKKLEQPSTSSSQGARIDTMLSTIEMIMERLFVDGMPPPRENQEQQNRNHNARRPQVIQNKQINPSDPPVRPPFQ